MFQMIRNLILWFAVLSPALAENRTFGYGDHVCNAEDICTGDRIDIESDSEFSLKCSTDRACANATIVVHSGCSFRADGIQCRNGREACRNAKIVVYSSNLPTYIGRSLNCNGAANENKVRVCENLQLTLVDSKLKLDCESGTDDCANVVVHMFGSSTLELVNDFDCNNPATIYMYDNWTLIDNGVSCYTLVTVGPTTSTSASTTTTQVPTTTITSTSARSTTTTEKPLTTTTTSTTKTPTVPRTTPPPITTSKEESNKESGTLDVAIYGAIAAAVVIVIVLFCVNCWAYVYYRGKRKSEENRMKAEEEERKAEKEASTNQLITVIKTDQLMAVTSLSPTECECIGEVVYVRNDESEEKATLYVTPGVPKLESSSSGGRW